MAYQALYREWRPNTFSEICGQDAIVNTLKRQVITGRIAHAYLFSGTRGTGKTTAAKVLSKAINCLAPVDGDPCGVCTACEALSHENNMDVIEIDAASNNGVDEIRDLREKVKYPPASVKYKVYIIDEVHMLSAGAFNALLKTLEEPPAHAVFILATTEPQRLPATILSRCQRFEFRRIPADVIVDRLMLVLGGIGRSADMDALSEIARAAEGSMRDALSLLDVCLSYTDNEVSLALTRDVIGGMGREFTFEFMDALIDEDARRALTMIDEMMRMGRDPQVFMRDVAYHARCALLAGMIGEGLADIIETTREDAERFREQFDRASYDKLIRIMELFMRAEPELKWASRPRTMLELTAARACHPEEEPGAALSERIASLERKLARGVSVAPQPVDKPKPVEKPKPAPKQEKPAPVPVAVSAPAEFARAVKALSEQNASVKNALSGMLFVSLADGLLSVEFDKKHMMYMKLLERKRDVLEAGFSEAFGAPVKLIMQLVGEGGQTKPAEAKAKNVIEQSYDIFGREHIEFTD